MKHATRALALAIAVLCLAACEPEHEANGIHRTSTYAEVVNTTRPQPRATTTTRSPYLPQCFERVRAAYADVAALKAIHDDWHDRYLASLTDKSATTELLRVYLSQDARSAAESLDRIATMGDTACLRNSIGFAVCIDLVRDTAGSRQIETADLEARASYENNTWQSRSYALGEAHRAADRAMSRVSLLYWTCASKAAYPDTTTTKAP